MVYEIQFDGRYSFCIYENEWPHATLYQSLERWNYRYLAEDEARAILTGIYLNRRQYGGEV